MWSLAKTLVTDLTYKSSDFPFVGSLKLTVVFFEEGIRFGNQVEQICRKIFLVGLGHKPQNQNCFECM